jgi:hypothetical protein
MFGAFMGKTILLTSAPTHHNHRVLEPSPRFRIALSICITWCAIAFNGSANNAQDTVTLRVNNNWGQNVTFRIWARDAETRGYEVNIPYRYRAPITLRSDDPFYVKVSWGRSKNFFQAGPLNLKQFLREHRDYVLDISQLAAGDESVNMPPTLLLSLRNSDPDEYDEVLLGQFFEPSNWERVLHVRSDLRDSRGLPRSIGFRIRSDQTLNVDRPWYETTLDTGRTIAVMLRSPDPFILQAVVHGKVFESAPLPLKDALRADSKAQLLITTAAAGNDATADVAMFLVGKQYLGEPFVQIDAHGNESPANLVQLKTNQAH